ncbi:VanZ family protein [Fusibacter sp. JL298sf-3]
MRTHKSYYKWMPWLLVGLCMAAIFYFSSQPGQLSDHLSRDAAKKVLSWTEGALGMDANAVQAVNIKLRKYAHFLIFMCLGIALSAALIRSKHLHYKRLFVVFALCVGYAILDETHQLFVPGRGAQVRDVFIDTAGAFTGIVIYVLILRASKRTFRAIRRCARRETSL